MFSNWKSAVYEYVHRRNQLEIDSSVGELAPIVRDDRFLRVLDARLRRFKAGLQARKAKPVKIETGLKIRAAAHAGPETTVELEMRRTFEYELLERVHREERLERERLTVVKLGKQWIIARIEPDVSERRSSAFRPPQTAEAGHEDDSEARTRSVPFLNHRIFPGIAGDSAFRSRAVPYDRRKAQQYADTWWNGANPRYMRFEVDCTNFVSQCLFAGGAPMNYTGKRESGWWYQGMSGGQELWSFSWAVAQSLQAYLGASRTGLKAEAVESPRQLTIGDVICYDWDGNGHYQHNAIVTAIDAAGMPLVNAHTTDSRHRYWDYRDSYAWTPNTRYRFFHIADFF